MGSNGRRSEPQATKNCPVCARISGIDQSDAGDIGRAYLHRCQQTRFRMTRADNVAA